MRTVSDIKCYEELQPQRILIFVWFRCIAVTRTILINQQAVVSRTFTFKLRLNIFGSHAASFKRPLLSVDQSMCVRYSVRLFVRNFDAKISKTIRCRGSCPIWSLRKSAHGASIGDINDEVTWLYVDVMLVTSQNSKSSRSDTRIWELTETPSCCYTHAQRATCWGQRTVR